MFEKLVVSTAGKRKGRTTTFFVCTAIVYLSAIAVALVMSVLLADPKLADTSDSIVHIANLPPAPRGPRPPKVNVTHPDSAGTPRLDLNNLLKYADIVNHPQNGPPRLPLPVATDFGANDGVVGGVRDGVPGAIDIPGPNPKGGEPPPRPDPPPVKPATTTIVTENRPVRLPSTVLQGKAIERRVPVYPELVRRIRLQGDVAVEVIISPEGRVESARAISGHPMLIATALEAARGWRFGPTILNGVPVRVTGVITFVFKLSD
jgi:periplasmic protein TonB